MYQLHRAGMAFLQIDAGDAAIVDLAEELAEVGATLVPHPCFWDKGRFIACLDDAIGEVDILAKALIGVLPLMFRSQNILFWWFDLISGLCFILDYLLRWSIADYRLKKKSWKAFFIYPFAIWS